MPQNVWVIWLEAIGCFVLWVLYGIGRTRRSHRVRNWARRVPRARRGVLAGLMFVAPAVALGGLVLAVALEHGVAANGLAPWAWAAIAFGGIGYVHCQTLATALLVTLAERS